MITTLPTPPSRSDPTNFAVRADDFLAALPTFATEVNDIAADIEAAEITVLAANDTAVAAAATAIAAGTATVWISGTAYAQYAAVIDPVTYVTYRSKNAITSTTRPALDATNWTTTMVDLTSDQTIEGVKTFSSSPVVPAGATGSQAPRVSEVVTLTGAQSVAGVKSFTNTPTVPAGATGSGVPRAEEVVLRTQILGTVNQSGGVPTGAVIQSGSNANGSYIRYADGTQICWANPTTVHTTNTAQGAFFITGALTVTFPIAFSAAPVVTASATHSSGAPCWGGTATPTTAGLVAVYLFSAANTATARLAYTAVGRWF